jgi:hypothetical protein
MQLEFSVSTEGVNVVYYSIEVRQILILMRKLILSQKKKEYLFLR